MHVDLVKADVQTSAALSLLSFTDLAPLQIFFPAGLTPAGPSDRGTGNKYKPMARACYAKKHVHIDAFGILSPIDLPSALLIYTF